PYGKGLADQALASLRDGGWLTPGALLWSRKRRPLPSKDRKAFQNLNGALTTTRSSCFSRPHPEERSEGPRLEGWAASSFETRVKNTLLRMRLTSAPSEQLFDIGELQFDISRTAVVALTGIGRVFHLAEQRVHLFRLE